MPIDLEALEGSLRGSLIRPEDARYDTARAVYNAMHDRHPAAVVQADDVADVIRTVRAVAGTGLDLAIRGGSHSVPGFGTCDDGIVLDLRALHGVRVDLPRRTARVGGGATWGELDHATNVFGLATTGGLISTTGVVGLTLGGGIGHLARHFGLSCDNLVSADVVLADGSFVTASEDDHGDLFWALRGGGGNFGVVTSMELRLHEVGDIYGGPILFEADDAAEVLRFFREFVDDAPEELGVFFAWQIAPPLPFVPPDRVGELMCALIPCWSGDPSTGENVIKPCFDAGRVVASHVDTMPYPALNSAFDALEPPGLQHYWKADFVAELTDEAIAAHVEHGRHVPVINSTMHLYPINGAVHDVRSDATAFAHRGAKYACVIAGVWPDPADNDANIRWVRDYYAAVHPYSGFEAGYVNFMSGDDADRLQQNYGENFERLRRVKATYDPDNLFHLNQNIEPAATT